MKNGQPKNGFSQTVISQEDTGEWTLLVGILFYVDQFERKKEKYHDNPRFCSGIVAVLFLRIKLFNVPLFELIF